MTCGRIICSIFRMSRPSSILYGYSMANLITNKHKKLEHAKKPSGFQKRTSARKLRRQVTTEITSPSALRTKRSPKHAARKRSGRCPICLHRLSKNSRGTRYVRSCPHCNAQVMPEVKCPRCSTFRVWGNNDETRCKGCGNPVE